MVKKGYQKAIVTIGMLMAGVSPVFAGDITVDDFQNANLEKGVSNIEAGAKTGANIVLTIIIYGAIVLGIIFFLWGASMASSKDTREEGKLKDGIKLAVLGLVFIAVGFVIRKVAGIS